MYLSGGAVWTYNSVESIRAADPGGDPVLQELLVNSFEEGLEWLEELGATTKDPEYDLPGHGRAIDPADFTQLMVDHVERTGGELRLETPMLNLLSEDGAVVGTIVGDEDRSKVRADAVILATGGFQGNEELIERHIPGLRGS